MYHVVHFYHEGTVDVVSNIWVTPRKSQSYWPSKNGAKMLLNHSVPQPDWQIHSVKVMFSTGDRIRGTKCKKNILPIKPDDLLLARNKAKQAEQTSELSEFETPVCKQPRKPKARKRLIQDDSDESSDSDLDVKRLNDLPFPPAPILPTPPHAPTLPTPLPVTYSTTTALPVTFGACATTDNNQVLDNISKYLGKLTEQMNDLQLSMNEIKRSIENNKDNIAQSVDIKKCQTIDEIINLNSELSDNEVQKTVEIHLSLVGGNSLNHKVKRVLERIFSNNLAQQCNWSGKNGKFALKELEVLWKTVFGALPRDTTSQSVTDFQIKSAINSWFKYSKDRDGGREKRKTNDTQTTTGN